MQRFGSPALPDEIVGQKVQQFVLHGTLRLETEITGILHEGFAEVMHPDAIHPDAGRQRIGGRGDGVGKIEPASTAGECRPILGRQNFKKPAWHRCPSSDRIAPLKNHGVAQHFRILHDHCTRSGVLMFHGNGIQLCQQAAIGVARCSGQVERHIPHRKPDRSITGNQQRNERVRFIVASGPGVPDDRAVCSGDVGHGRRLGGHESINDSLIDTAGFPFLRFQDEIPLQIGPWTEDRIFGKGSPGDQLPPALGDMGTQLLRREGQEEDRCLRNVRFRGGDMNQIVRRPFTCDLECFCIMGRLLVLDFVQLSSELLLERLTCFSHRSNARAVVRFDGAGEHAVQ